AGQTPHIRQPWSPPDGAPPAPLRGPLPNSPPARGVPPVSPPLLAFHQPWPPASDQPRSRANRPKRRQGPFRLAVRPLHVGPASYWLRPLRPAPVGPSARALPPYLSTVAAGRAPSFQPPSPLPPGVRRSYSRAVH